MSKAQNAGGLLLLLITTLTIFIAMSIASKTLLDVDNTFAIGTTAKNSTKLAGQTLQQYSDLQTPILMVLAGAVLVYALYAWKV